VKGETFAFFVLKKINRTKIVLNHDFNKI